MYKEPAYKTEARATYHRDGTISYFDIISQVWARDYAFEIAGSWDKMQSFRDEERTRVRSMAKRYTKDHHRAWEASECI